MRSVEASVVESNGGDCSGGSICIDISVRWKSNGECSSIEKLFPAVFLDH